MRLIRPRLMVNSLILAALMLAIVLLFPWLFVRLGDWQREFNQLMTGYLQQIEQNTLQAGLGLIGVSFLYGVLHSLGPGHGKFIIASYLATHQSRLKGSIGLSLCASFMQGVVAVAAVTFLVVILNLSSAYFKLSQLWLERGAWILLILLGLYWCYQSLQTWRQPQQAAKQAPKIQKISQKLTALSPAAGQSAVKNPDFFSPAHAHDACGCGHQHLPTAEQMAAATTWRSKLLIVLSIGMRPCTGAIFVLFLTYMLGVYPWGVAATLAMSAGTGLSLSAFALLVMYARKYAERLGQWYVSPKQRRKLSGLGKFAAGGLLIFFAAAFLYGTTLNSSGGAILFGR